MLIVLAAMSGIALAGTYRSNVKASDAEIAGYENP
jgi:hypothetical protein